MLFYHGFQVYSQVVAHEIGHNWGAKHDPVNPSMWHCSPTTSKGGKFLMWAYSVLATDPNSFKFSPCSKKVIRAVLEVCTLTGNTVFNYFFFANIIFFLNYRTFIISSHTSIFSARLGFFFPMHELNLIY